MPDAAEVILIPEIVNKLERIAPGIRFDLFPADGRNVLEDLDSGRSRRGTGSVGQCEAGFGLDRTPSVHPLYRTADCFSRGDPWRSCQKVCGVAGTEGSTTPAATTFDPDF